MKTSPACKALDFAMVEVRVLSRIVWPLTIFWVKLDCRRVGLLLSGVAKVRPTRAPLDSNGLLLALPGVLKVKLKDCRPGGWVVLVGVLLPPPVAVKVSVQAI